ncbi:MAG: hypothetical protein COB20_05995 [SAR86 cluster bacterium]|uniref:Lysylphosphatidylglycerol synthetase family protein n=1 Tax=SAR86 cluster bacterium TaxID=2030880 RepID=A0A2A4X9S4_9GAMM|nr:MAG: hypothetical protein COB20_05995 [SAR86 cluster bacterium]
MKINKAFMAAIKLLVIVVVFSWLFRYANVTFIDVIKDLSRVSPVLFIFPLFLFLLHTLITYSAWHKSLLLFGVQESVSKTAPLFAFSTLTKYVPGGIWHAGSRVFVLATYGHSKLKVLFSVLIETVLSVSVATILLCFLYPFINLNQNIIGNSAVLDLFAPAAGLLLTACIVAPFFYKLVFFKYASKGNNGSNAIEFRTKQLATLALLHALGLAIYVLGYYFTFKAYLPEQNLFSADFAFIVMAATLSGFLVIFAPAGLGVRESVLYLAFSQLIDDSMLVTICLAPRLLLLVAEVLFFCMIKAVRTSYFSKVSA